MTELARTLGLGSVLTILALAGGTIAAAKTSTLDSPDASTVKPAGVFSNSTSTSVNINGTQPVTGGGVSWMNNATGNDQSISPYVICAT